MNLGPLVYRPGDEYLYPQFTNRRRRFRWRLECCIENKYVAHAYTRRGAYAKALRYKTRGILWQETVIR